MRNLFWALLICFAILIAVGAGTALGIHWAGLPNGMRISVDGENIEGSMVAAAAGALAAVIVGLVLVIVIGALISVAVAVPIVIIVALFLGLSPIVVPVLLVVGVCVLLSRRSKRQATIAAPNASSMPAPTS
jgi:hypothetical protein